MQDAFLAALERIESFDLSRPFAPWFFRIVLNRGLNARESRSIRRVEPLPEDRHSAGASPLELAVRAEVRERFARAVETLPERKRIAIELFDVEGFSSLEIAEALEIPQGTVRWYVHEARRALRQALEPLTDEEIEHEPRS